VAGRPLYVTMSGGLDSTGVAVLAREIIADFVGVTFRVEGPAPASDVRDDLHYNCDSLVSPVAQPFRAATRAGGAGLKGLRYKGARW
jgi:hypothetical protein